MDNDVFVKTLIDATKNKKIDWHNSKLHLMSKKYKSYEVKKGANIIAIEKYQTIEYDMHGDELHGYACRLYICDDVYNVLSEIFESDLREDGVLMRLYRLAERVVNKVDDIMQLFVDDLKDEDDELPF